MPTVHLTVKGKVQGVFFRATAKEMANKIGVKGWVKNTREGNVESIATGSTTQLAQYIKWCEEGPAGAKVSEVIRTETDDTQFSDFVIVR